AERSRPDCEHEPRDRLAIQLPPSACFCPTVQSSALMMFALLPLPSESSTFTAHSRTPGATPTTPTELLAAAIVPLTWVRCPLSSSGSVVPVISLNPPA